MSEMTACKENGSKASEQEVTDSVVSKQRRLSGQSVSSTASSSVSRSSLSSFRGGSSVGLGLSAFERTMSEGAFACHIDIERICPGCESILEGCNEDVACLALIVLGTFTHRYPEHTATILCDVLNCIARY